MSSKTPMVGTSEPFISQVSISHTHICMTIMLPFCYFNLYQLDVPRTRSMGVQRPARIILLLITSCLAPTLSCFSHISLIIGSLSQYKFVSRARDQPCTCVVIHRFIYIYREDGRFF